MTTLASTKLIQNDLAVNILIVFISEINFIDFGSKHCKKYCSLGWMLVGLWMDNLETLLWISVLDPQSR